MAEPRKPASAAASAAIRREVGRKLLAEPGKLWSALPVEWPTATEADRLAEAAGDHEITQLPGPIWRFLNTLGQLIAKPRQSFAHVHEPVAHGSVLKFLACVRIPLWAVTLAAVLQAMDWTGAPEAIAIRPVHDLLEPQLTSAMSLWLLLMIPVGLPLLYFVSGLTSHVALTLTGGAPRSIAASMRATGYALALPLIIVALLDALVHTRVIALPVEAFFVAVATLVLVYIRQLAYALAGTHNISLVRCVFVSLVPVALLAGLTFARGYLELPTFPGWSPHLGSPYFIP